MGSPGRKSRLLFRLGDQFLSGGGPIWRVPYFRPTSAGLAAARILKDPDFFNFLVLLTGQSPGEFHRAFLAPMLLRLIINNPCPRGGSINHRFTGTRIAAEFETETNLSLVNTLPLEALNMLAVATYLRKK